MDHTLTETNHLDMQPNIQLVGEDSFTKAVRLVFGFNGGENACKIQLICDGASGCPEPDFGLIEKIMAGAKENPPVIPLICAEETKHWQAAGLDFPGELVISTDNLLAIGERILLLSKLYGTSDSFKAPWIKDALVGHFRRRLGMDQEHHDTGSDLADALIKLEEAIESGNVSEVEFWTKKGEKASKTKPEHIIDESAKWMGLFPNNAKALREHSNAIVRNLSEPSDKGKLCELLENLKSSLPRWRGDLISILFPHKPQILVVDDQSDEICRRLGALRPIREDAEGATLEEIIDFIPSFEQEQKCDDYKKALIDLLQKEHSNLRKYDAILLDLSFGDEKNRNGFRSQPTGWNLLQILKKWLPDIPILIHSSYGDATQVRLAYERGASWFLRKDESHKLLSRLRAIIRDSLWEREWRSVKQNFDLQSESGFEDVELYLIWKTVEHMPGGKILVRKLSGGIGGAKTLHVSREINGSYDRVAPVVIKIDDKFPMLLERERYLRFIQPYLSNMAGRIDVPLHVGGRNQGAISYTYAGGSQGRRGERREVLTLEELLNLNLNRRHQAIQPASCYEQLFDALLKEILPRIHSINPVGEPSEMDFPNPVFNEGSPLDGYLCRMPPDAVIDLEEPLTSPECEGSQMLHVYDISKPKSMGEWGHVQCLMMRENGLMHRIDLRGLLGSFYSEHRKFRPMQPIWINKLEETSDECCLKQQWEMLWTQKDGVSLHDRTDHKAFSFMKAGLDNLISGGNVADALVKLIGWLTNSEEVARKALEASPCGIIHGDLNLGNVMVERERGKGPVPYNSAPWLIDFARTRRGQIVYDFTQLELNLCLGLMRPDFFACDAASFFDWSALDSFVSNFIKTPWQDPPCVKSDPRLEFVYYLMCQVRDAAGRAGIGDDAYITSRVWESLVAHKILCRKWQKKPNDMDLRFRCVWSLQQAFLMARVLGWNPNGLK